MRLRLLFGTALCMLVAGWLFDAALPEVARLHDSVRSEPVQHDGAEPAFAAHAGGVDYRILPVARYDIAGLVVSRHDSSAWWDWIHAASNDHLNVVDLCLVWGDNAADGAYRKMRFASGQFVCYVETDDADAWQPRYLRSLSNNHLLTDDPAIARRLRGLRVGDQVRLTGELAAYTHNAGFAFSRGTSTVREDMGNGACETVFVRSVEVLARAPAWPRLLLWVGCGLLSLALLRWWRQPHRAA